MAFFAKGAEEFAIFLGLPALDYSVDSIRQIDEMCTIVFNEKPKSFLSKLIKGSANKKDISNTSLLFGSYIGEVMIRYHGGKWSFEKNIGEDKKIVLTISQTKIFPVEKAYRKINNPDEGDLSYYYHLITSTLPKLS